MNAAAATLQPGDLSAMDTITPAIMIGGSGTRLWPLSRADRPKQFHALGGGASLLQQTLARFSGPLYDRAWLLAGEANAGIGETHAERAGIAVAGCIVEPEPRNTAPALAAAAYVIGADDPGRLILAAPSDHLMTAPDAFHAAVATAREAALGGRIVTFGIRPTRAETGFGYIEVSTSGHAGAVQPVARFVEKPSREVAEGYVADGRHLWNAGIFLFTAATMIEELERHAPEVCAAARRACLRARAAGSRVRLDAGAFAAAPDISIDNAVMEHSERVAVAPCDPGWNDVGSWAAVLDVSAADASGNAFAGDVIAVDAEGCLVQSSGGRLVALAGVSGLAVIDTEDATLVVDLAASQSVKEIVRRVAAAGRDEIARSAGADHPWGWSRRLVAGPDDCSVRRVHLLPGRQIEVGEDARDAVSLTVIDGSVEIVSGGAVERLCRGRSFDLAGRAGTDVTIRNPGIAAAELVLVAVAAGGTAIAAADGTTGQGAPALAIVGGRG